MDIKTIMATQLTETEVMVFLLVRNGNTYRDIEKMPFGFSRGTVQTVYRSAADKVQKMVEAEILPPELV